MTDVWPILFWGAFGLLSYTHVGFPALMALVGALDRGRARGPDGGPRPKVSLIIPAYNEARIIRQKLENALAIDYPKDRLEILLGSDASTDDTNAIAEEFRSRGVRLFFFEERRGKVSMLNDLTAAATGDVFCFCDANVMFRPDALGRLVDRLRDPSVGAVTADVRLKSEDSDFGEGESLYYKVERAIQLGESRIGSVMATDGGMYVQRRELFRPLPAAALNEDFSNTMSVIRQGKRFVYEPDAVADESGTPSSGIEFRRRVRVAAGSVQSLKWGEWPPLSRPVELWQYLSHKLLRWLGPYLLVSLFAGSVLSWPQGVAYRAALLAQGAFYALAAVSALSVRVRRTPIGGIPFYFTMSHVAMPIGHVRGLLNRQKVTWNRTDRGGGSAAPALAVAAPREVPR
ncbi:MAG TPA: glycosyltransferase family 2 protein [Planctomycetaceae bacterium]